MFISCTDLSQSIWYTDDSNIQLSESNPVDAHQAGDIDSSRGQKWVAHGLRVVYLWA